MWLLSKESASQLRPPSELFIASANYRGDDISLPLKAVSSAFLGGISCRTPDGTFEFLNPDTRFLSYCATLIVGAATTAALLGPVLYRIFDLSRHEKGTKTIYGQFAFISSILAHLAYLSHLLFCEYSPTFLEISVPTAGFATSLLQYVQDGRVWVSSGEVLLYWPGVAFCYLSFALDFYLRYGLKHSILLIAASLFSVISFVLELNNEERTSEEQKASVDTTNILSKISVSYANELLYKGSKGEITHSDLPKAPADLNAYNCGHGLEEALGKRSESNGYRLLLSLAEFLGTKLVAVFFLDTLCEVISYLSPSVLSLFLHSLELYVDGKSPIYVSYYYAVLLSLLPVLTTSLRNINTLTTTHTYIMTRTSIITIIYRKAMRLSPSGREKFDSSKIMNLINVDANQVDGLAGFLPLLISAPVGIIISTYQLWKFLGVSMFAALLIYGLLAPITGLLTSKISGYVPEQMMVKDKRNKLTSNLFRTIKSLKLYAWETPFYERVVDVRQNEELALGRKITILFTALISLLNSTGDMVAITVFSTFLFLKEGTLTASVVFPSLLLFNLATEPFQILPMAFVNLTQMLTSQRRINELLVEKDNDYLNYTRLGETAHGYEENSIKVENATVSWDGDESEQKIALKEISFQATRGDLLCITGKVGSGKTALLRALSGDLSILNGSVTIKGALAYCSQDAWLQNLSLKDNILFGQSYDEKWYARVVESCQLVDDIKQMPEGDKTEVGERGISLSGGQKARVALARAIYARADIYLFDDVLSAVDEHVSGHLIRNIFSKDGILGNRTIVLATNNVKVLSQASTIIELAEKKIAEISSFQEVVSHGNSSKIYRLIEEFGHAQDLKQEAEKVELRKPYVIQKEADFPDFYPPTQYAMPLDIAPVNIRLTSDDDEEQDNNSVSLTIYRRYFEFLPWWMYIVLIGLIISTTIVIRSQTLYLSYMSNKALTNMFDARWYLLGYFAIVVISIAGLIFSMIWNLVIMGLRISNIMHNHMLWNVMHAPMSFFDKTPLGRLINRFTSDISQLDFSVPLQFYFAIHSVIDVGVMAAIIVISSPLSALLIIPLSFFGNKIRLLYVPSQKKISRMGSAADSPILSHIEDSLKGRLIVCSFDRMAQFSAVYEERVNYWIQITYVQRNISMWLSYRIRLIASILMLSTTLSVSWLITKNLISVGYCGAVVNFASSMGMMLTQTLGMLSQLEVSGVSLDRILEYINIDQEAPSHIEATEPDSSWPSSGLVKFDDLSARYSPEGPDVLKNLSFTIDGGEKIGIVGRTGSGKSTLTMAIFRILESRSGHIDIDDINTSLLGLSDLRSKLSIIPQDAQIFDGTLRENLDPLNTADDAKLWEVLELCHLKTHFESIEGGLDAPLSDGGENLSRGQAQLVCLGRALIHEAKVLVLDEATASVDVETDRVVQETIRKNFSERTIITIAHRINTIMDNDRILVLDYGEIREFDTPQKLLDTKGMFYGLYNASKKANDKKEDGGE